MQALAKKMLFAGHDLVRAQSSVRRFQVIQEHTYRAPSDGQLGLQDEHRNEPGQRTGRQNPRWLAATVFLESAD